MANELAYSPEVRQITGTPSEISSASAAREAGCLQAELCTRRADDVCPDFSARAFAYIASFAVASPVGATFTGERLTDLMKQAGIRPHDDRAFGAIFSKAIREGYIQPVGYAPRVKGHGTAGGRVYSPGVLV